MPSSLMYSWGIHEFLKTVIEYWWAAVSVLTLSLSSNNFLPGYEQLSINNSIESKFIVLVF